MSLETHISGSEDRLIDSLHFAGQSSASYVIERRGVSFAPQTASDFKPGGVRLMRFSLADQMGWLVGDTVRLVLTLHNARVPVPPSDGNPGDPRSLNPITDSPASIFRRMRLTANGSATIEDVEEYGRTHQIFSTLLPAQRRMNDIAESWGGSEANPTLGYPAVGEPIPGQRARTVVVHLLSSFLSQGRNIALNAIPLVLELELGEMNDAFMGEENEWYITRPRLIADVLTLDQALQNSYSKHLLDGKLLPFSMHGLYSIRATVPAGSNLYSLPIVRGFTRLSTVYISFFIENTGKWTRTFASPMLRGDLASPNTTQDDDTEWWLTIGGERFPEFNVECHKESYHRLRVAQLMHQGTDSCSITPLQFQTYTHILGMNLEKTPGRAAHTGRNTRGGSQLTLNFKQLHEITSIHVVLHFEQVVNVSAAGIEVLD